jgi:adhesin transport system outer membrane protein
MTLSSLLLRKRSLKPWLTLAAGVAMLSSPLCMAKTYVVLLKSPDGERDRVQIVNPDGVYGIYAAGYGTYVDKAFITVPKVSDELINSQFGPALEVMREILAAGRPPLQHSYVALLQHQEGALGSMYVQIRSEAVILNEANQAVNTDGSSSQPFKVETGKLEADFGPLLATLVETRKAGMVPTTYVVLLEDPDGKVGKVSVTDQRGSVLIEQAGQAVDLDIHAAPMQPFQVDQTQISTDFGAAIEARPPLPTNITLYFESGGTKLTPDSQATLDKLLQELRNWPAPDITIKGHADTVGRNALNEALSQARAEFVAQQIRSLDPRINQVEVLAFGERNLLIPTPEDTPEVKNRRVEVHVW